MERVHLLRRLVFQKGQGSCSGTLMSLKLRSLQNIYLRKTRWGKYVVSLLCFICNCMTWIFWRAESKEFNKYGAFVYASNNFRFILRCFPYVVFIAVRALGEDVDFIYCGVRFLWI